MIGFIFGLLFIGLIAGGLARLAVPGRQNLSIPATIVLGIVGSLVGGFLGRVLLHHDAHSGYFQTSGIIGSVIGAVIVLLVWLRVSDRNRITR